jgi:hypothetical protein
MTVEGTGMRRVVQARQPALLTFELDDLFLDNHNATTFTFPFSSRV